MSQSNLSGPLYKNKVFLSAALVVCLFCWGLYNIHQREISAENTMKDISPDFVPCIVDTKKYARSLKYSADSQMYDERSRKYEETFKRVAQKLISDVKKGNGLAIKYIRAYQYTGKHLPNMNALVVDCDALEKKLHNTYFSPLF